MYLIQLVFSNLCIHEVKRKWRELPIRHSILNIGLLANLLLLEYYLLLYGILSHPIQLLADGDKK